MLGGIPIFWGYNTSYLGLFFIVMIFSMVAQFRVNSTFQKYAKVANSRGLTGADVARQMLESARSEEHTSELQSP